MTERDSSPAISVVIAAYNDWLLLDACLLSLAQQTLGPTFEVIVVDDGSEEEAPEFILRWKQFFALTILRQGHAGIPAARNAGLRASKGSAVLFVDADSRLQSSCLSNFDVFINDCPGHSSFQLHLTSDCSTVSGRVEGLRLATLQEHMLQANGCIRYVNTAAFAIRRKMFDIEKGLFDTSAPRGEDTLLLVNLIQRRQLPLFVADAVVQHRVPLTFLESVRKCMRSAYLEARAYDIIASKGVRIRVSNRKRLRMLLSMWKICRERSLGWSAWLGLATRQALARAVSLGCRWGLFPFRATHGQEAPFGRIQDVTDV